MNVISLCALLVPPALQQEAGGPLSYVDSSSTLQSLQFEGGDTELEFADTNGDGHLDLVTIGDHGNPLVNTNQMGLITFFGDGTGGWSLFQTGSFGYGGLALGDVNNDGFLDAGYGMHHNYATDDFGDQLLEVALGDGSGTSWTPWDDGLGESGETWGMFATDFADVDNDGRLDVLSNSFGCCAGVHVYRNNGDGTWTESFGFLGGNASASAAFGDFDADGNADFAVANSSGTLWRGDGSGGFTNVDGNLPGSAMGRAGFAFGDLNGDGRQEVAFRGSGGALEVWSYTGSSSWIDYSNGLPTASGYDLVQLVDMDVDGSLDLVAAGSNSVGIWSFAQGGWSLLHELTVAPGASSSDTAAFRAHLDADHNGRPDFALMQDESCGLFCSRNELYFFREASVPSVLEAFVSAPRGGAVWRAGSARVIEWSSAVPAGAAATVDIELSSTGAQGPWTRLASDAPNDGQHQLVVPRALDTVDAYVRIRVKSGPNAAEARNPLPFTILPGPSATYHGPGTLVPR